MYVYSMIVIHIACKCTNVPFWLKLIICSSTNGRGHKSGPKEAKGHRAAGSHARLEVIDAFYMGGVGKEGPGTHPGGS